MLFKRTILLQLIMMLFCLLLSCTSDEQKTVIKKSEDSTLVKASMSSTQSASPLSTSSKFIEFDSTISDAYLMGQFSPSKDKQFILIDKKHASRSGMYLHKETYAAFQKMFEAAKKEGISLIIKSATRPFESQKRIWEDKWTGKRLVEDGQNISKTIPNHKDRALKILEYSSMPGTSRHHWGTDIDLNNFTNQYFEKGKGLKEYEWLKKHASNYGFCQPYTQKGVKRPDGYNEEKWHWSFLPIAKKLTSQYRLRLDNDHIKGFKGAETAKDIRVVEKYVLGINQACL